MLNIAFIPFMSWMSRASGGGFPKIPWGLDQFILALPYLLYYQYVGWWVVPSYFIAVIGLRLAHGRFFHYKLPFKQGSQPEKAEVLIPKFLPIPFQKALGMLLTGLCVTVGISLVLALHGFYLASLILALSGAAKCIAYLLPKTEQSELARGGFLGLGVAVTL